MVELITSDGEQLSGLIAQILSISCVICKEEIKGQRAEKEVKGIFKNQ